MKLIGGINFFPFVVDQEGDKLLTGSNEKLLRIFNLQKPESGN